MADYGNFIRDYECFSTTTGSNFEDHIRWDKPASNLLTADFNTVDTGDTITIGYTAYHIFSITPKDANAEYDGYSNGFIVSKQGKVFYADYILEQYYQEYFEDWAHSIWSPEDVANNSQRYACPMRVRWLGFLRMYVDGASRLYPIFEEANQTITEVTWTDTANISAKEPYETFSGTVSATATKYQRTVSSLEVSTLTTTETSKSATITNKMYTSPGVKRLITLSSDGSGHDMYVTISDWSTKIYSIEQVPNSTYDLYTGKELTNGDSFLSAFRVKLVKTNQYYQTGITSYPEQSLTLSKMSNKVVSESDSVFAFDYDISAITETSTTSISYTISTFHRLKSGTGKFANVQRPIAFSYGDTISNVVDFSTMGSLTYDDDTTISLADVTINSQSISATYDTNTTLALPHTVNVDTPSEFTLHYSMSLDYFGSLSFDDLCHTEDSAHVGSVVLSNFKQVFQPNELIDFGDNAVIYVYSADTSIIEPLVTITRANFINYVTNKDDKYGVLASTLLEDYKDSVINLTFMCYGTIITQPIAINYSTGSFSVTNSFKRSYIFDPEDEEFEFDYTGLSLSVTYHTKSFSNGEVVDTETTETYDAEDFTITPDPVILNPVEEEDHAMNFLYTTAGGQTYQTSITITTTPLKALSIQVSGSGSSITYYDNDLDVFKLPDDEEITFTVIYNDPTYNTEVSSEDLTYFYDDAHTQEIDEGDDINKSVVARSGNNYIIYVHSEEHHIDGYYRIMFIADNIASVIFGEDVYFYYGNPLNCATNKAQVVLSCTHASGNTSTITNPNRFTFKNGETVIMPDNQGNPPSGNLSVYVDNTEYALGNTSTKVHWTNPYGVMVLDTSNFQVAYNNNADAINPGTITGKIVYYEDTTHTSKCQFEQALTYSSESTIVYDKFTATGSNALSGYTFNTKLAVTMGGEAELTGTVTISAKNQFYDANDSTNRPEYITSSVNVKILEITNITGIKLLSIKRNYIVGEEFLNENDETRVKVYYKDASNPPVTRTFECYLRDGLTGLNIYPLPGTKLNQIVAGKEITVTSVSDYNVVAKYTIDVEPYVAYGERQTHKLVVLYTIYPCPDGVIRQAYFLVGETVIKNDEEINATVTTANGRVINSAEGVTVRDLEFFGYFEDVQDKKTNAKLILFEDYVAPTEGSNNVTVKFPCYQEGNADRINKCHFGIMFGNNNSKNRLFVSGNPDYKNKDWHTGQIDTTFVKDDTMLLDNYGYFEDLSECVYGETDNAVIGYDIIANDKLLVLKNHSDKETTVYFRQPQLVTAINNSGTAVTGLDDETLYQEEFSLSKGNNSVAGISPQSIVNFVGDSVFLTHDKQLVGLDLQGIIGDNQRYANSRSYYIDADLRNQDFTDAFLWTNNKYLFMVLKDKIYVAYYELKSEDQYEWFVIDVADVTSIVEIDGIIYFGTSKGNLFKFNKDIYRDANKIFAGYGLVYLTVNDETELITASGYLEDIDTTKKHYFRPIPDENATDKGYIYYSLGTIVNSGSANCDFEVKNGQDNPNNVIELVARRNGVTNDNVRELLLNRIKEDVPVFFNRYDNSVVDIECEPGSELESVYDGDGNLVSGLWGKPYFLREYETLEGDSLSHLYQVVNENGEVIPINKLYRARLCMRVSEPTEMVEIDVDEGKFKLTKDGEILDIIQYNSQVMSAFKGEIIEYHTVEAFYVVRPYTMGNLETEKTIWSWTITNDSGLPSELEVCQATNKLINSSVRTLAKIKVSSGAMMFNLEDFGFDKVDFDKNVVPRTYTHKRVLSSVKFVCFAFRSYNDMNSILGSLVVTYTLPYPSYGGD